MPSVDARRCVKDMPWRTRDAVCIGAHSSRRFEVSLTCPRTENRVKDSILTAKATSLTKAAIAHWLDTNSEQIADVLQSKPVVFPLIGGSLVEGTMTRGSDLDFCMMIDGDVRKENVDKLEPSFRHLISGLDGQLRQSGLSGVCRIARRIRYADQFLELHRCHESRAAVMRTGAKLNYLLSCRLLDIGGYDKESQVRIAIEPELLSLKERLYQSYRETLGYCSIPTTLPYLLKRPGGYNPRRVMEQVQLAINNVLLCISGVDSISGPLNAKISKVVDVTEREDIRTERVATKHKMSRAIDLFRDLKLLAAMDRNAHGKSLHQLTSDGYISKKQLECIRDLTGYCLKLTSSLPGMVGS